jgi:hypothetical protein
LKQFKGVMKGTGHFINVPFKAPKLEKSYGEDTGTVKERKLT